MAIKINFDRSGDVITDPKTPTFVLMNRAGKKLGPIPAENIVVKCYMNSADEVSFDVHKSISDDPMVIWDELKDLKLVWCRDWNKVFQVSVELDEGEGLTKYITGVGLGEAELSQAYLYEIQINTEDDISRKDYRVTVLYDPLHPEGSLLHRITEKIPHYTIKHVDSSVMNIQRTFTFDGTTIYDAFQEIAKEENLIFDINCYVDSDGQLKREINVYNLEDYGRDTAIFISTDNLTDEIRYTTDVDSVKNCFRLVAGDDLMTASVVNCNPNGTGYIWYVSDEMRSDMSPELSGRLSEYDDLYAYYQNEYSITPDVTQYNNLVNKYNTAYSVDYPTLPETIVGYPKLMECYYDALDFYYYLNDSLMPTVATQDTAATQEAAKLTRNNLTPVGVPDLNKASSSTAESAVLGMAKVLVDNRYKVTANTSSYTNHIWRGNFVVTNYSDEEDTATSAIITVDITGDYSTYVYQKIQKTLQKRITDKATDIVSLFDLSENDFKEAIKEYSLSNLKNLRESAQACIDVLVEQGIANKVTWAGQAQDLYTNMYVPYYNKLKYLDAELAVREDEIAIIAGEYDDDGTLKSEGILNILDNIRNQIQDALNFQAFMGDPLWLQFAAYRREDTYQNSNYISDGLTNAELFSKSLEFIEVAEKEIYKSAVLQHSITATLANLLAIQEFQPIVDYFELGNWLRVKVEDTIYKLRLIEYEVDFANLENINVTFSDVIKTVDGATDINSILSQASSMATSYNAVAHQAKQGSSSNNQLSSWVQNGLDLTTMKIINSASNQNISWDELGFLAREYSSINDSYDDTQLKIINKGLYITNDNWESAKAGIGEFTFWNPHDQETQLAYGVIADTLVGNLILGDTVGIYNSNNSVVIDEDGIQIKNGNDVVFSANNSGDLTLTGTVNANEGSIAGWTISSNKLAKGTLGNNDSFYMGTADLSSSNITIAGSNARKDWRLVVGSGFGVTKNGDLYANGANIQGTISGSNISGSNISGGTISGGAISGGTVTGATIDGNTISGGTISGTSITGSTFQVTGGTSGTPYVTIADGVNTAILESGQIYVRAGSLIGYMNQLGFIVGKYNTGGQAGVTSSGNGGSVWAANSSNVPTVELDGQTNMVQCLYNNNSRAEIGLNNPNSSSAYGVLRLRDSSNEDGVTANGQNGKVTAVSYDTRSDRNFKKNISGLLRSQSEALIYNLRPSQYQFINGDDKYRHGFIAQDVEKLIKEISGYDNWGIVSSTDINAGDGNKTVYKTLAYSELLADVVTVLQSQNDRIKELEEVINRIKEKACLK